MSGYDLQVLAMALEDLMQFGNKCCQEMLIKVICQDVIYRRAHLHWTQVLLSWNPSLLGVLCMARLILANVRYAVHDGSFTGGRQSASKLVSYTNWDCRVSLAF